MRNRLLILPMFLLITIGCVLFIGCSGLSTDGSDISERWDLSAHLDFGRQPVWSPDGEYIVFGDDRPDESGIWLWDGSMDTVKLFDELPSHNWDYVWSNSSDKIAVSCPINENDTSGGLWIVDIPQDTLIHLYNSGTNPSWYYDENHIIYELNYSKTEPTGIYSIDLTTLQREFIEADAYRPVCSPGSDLIAYTNNDIAGSLWITTLAGDNSQITGNGIFELVWSDDGNSLFAVHNNYLNQGSLIGWLLRLQKIEDSWSVDSLESSTSYISPNRSGSQITYMWQLNAHWAGVWIVRSDGSKLRIADYVIEPDLHPLHDRIVVSGVNGGIQIYTRRDGDWTPQDQVP